ncbi:MAG: GTPase [Nanoarchaeota archaeon]
MYRATTRPREGFKGRSSIPRDVLGYWEVIDKIISQCDVILEVLDARMPDLSRNDEIEAKIFASGKRLVFVMNKADLVSREVLDDDRKRLRKIAECVYVSSKDDYDLKKLKSLIFKDFSEVKNNFGKLRIGVVGYPNTGKSSLVNALIRKHSAKVSKRAGTTHGVQWMSFGDNALLMDSPGVIPLSNKDPVREGLLGAKDPERTVNPELVAMKLIEIFVSKNPNALRKFFGIEFSGDNPDVVIDSVALKNNYLKRGGLPDRQRAIIFILRAWVGGNLRL